MRKMKKIFAVFLVLMMCGQSFALVISDNDGAFFITRPEFDSLRNTFQSQCDSFSLNIDAKIDNAIAAYLEGIAIRPTKNFDILYSGQNCEKITCVGDWSELSLVPPTSGVHAFCTGTNKNEWPAAKYNGGNLIRTGMEKAITNDGKMIVCDIVGKKDDGTYDYLSWNGWYVDCSSLITKVGKLVEEKIGDAGFHYWQRSYLSYFCPLLDTGYYADYNTESNFLYMYERLDFGAVGQRYPSWNTIANFQYLNQSIEIRRKKDNDNFTNVISWDKDKNIEIGVDDVHYLWVPTSKGMTKSDWAKSVTLNIYRYANQATLSKNYSTPNQWADMGAGYMPVYGSVGEKSVNDILLHNYNINAESISFDKIKLIDGIPVFKGKNGDEVEWEIKMVDAEDYIFYFSYEKFDGIPDTSKCIKCTTDKSDIETVEPVIEDGNTKIKLVFTKDGVIWAKWKHKDILKNAVLDLQNCKNYQLTSKNN